jgi:hypothetical protein
LLRCSCVQRALSGACRPWRSARRSRRRELARLVVDVAAVGGQHLDLLLHLRHGVALLRWLRDCALRTASSSLRQLPACSSACASPALGLLVGGFDLLGRCLPARPRPRPGAGPLLVLRLQVGQALLGALAAFDHVADALFEPAHFQRASASAPCFRCSASLAA